MLVFEMKFSLLLFSVFTVTFALEPTLITLKAKHMDQGDDHSKYTSVTVEKLGEDNYFTLKISNDTEDPDPYFILNGGYMTYESDDQIFYGQISDNYLIFSGTPPVYATEWKVNSNGNLQHPRQDDDGWYFQREQADYKFLGVTEVPNDSSLLIHLNALQPN